MKPDEPWPCESDCYLPNPKVYDEQGRLATVTHMLSGRTLSFTYDAVNRLTTLTDPGGGMYRYAYDANAQGATLTVPAREQPSRSSRIWPMGRDGGEGDQKTHASCSRRLMRSEVDGQTPSLLIPKEGKH